MEDGEKQSWEQIRALVEASEEVRFQCQDWGELCEWKNRTLRQKDYLSGSQTGTAYYPLQRIE